MQYMKQNQTLGWFGNLQQYPLKGCGHTFLPGCGFLHHQALKHLQKRGSAGRTCHSHTRHSVSVIRHHTGKRTVGSICGSPRALLGRHCDISAQEEVLSDFRLVPPISLELVPVKPMVGYLYQGVHQRVQQGDDVMSEVTSLRLWDQKAQSAQAAPGRGLGLEPGATADPGMCWVPAARWLRHTG